MANDDILLVNAKVGDLAKALAYHLGLALSNNESCSTDDPSKEVKKHYVYGYQGLMDLLSIGKTTAYNILKSGAIDSAVIQRGKLIIIDSDLAMELLRLQKKKQRKRK